MASHSVRDQFASVGGSGGTTPPGESFTAGTSHAGAIYDNQHYQRHYATAPPIIWPSTSASGRTFTGIDPNLLARSPPPPPPRTQQSDPLGTACRCTLWGGHGPDSFGSTFSSIRWGKFKCYSNASQWGPSFCPVKFCLSARWGRVFGWPRSLAGNSLGRSSASFKSLCDGHKGSVSIWFEWSW